MYASISKKVGSVNNIYVRSDLAPEKPGRPMARIVLYSLLMRRTPILLAFLSLAGALGAQDFPVGRIVDRIECKDRRDQSYALYVPSGYASGKTLPVIFAFDSGANGRLAVERFREAADMYQFIVVGSNNARNGPWRPVIDAAWAMWTDAIALLPVDDKRVYAAGFASGARAASLFSWMIGRPVAGVIGCGAGLARETGLGDAIPAAYYGIVGTGDFNYREMNRLDVELDSKNVPHWIEIIEGGHDWPPVAECTAAVAWHEILAMRRGVIPRDDAVIDGFCTAELEQASALERSGALDWAVSRYERLASLLAGLRDTADLALSIRKIKDSPAYQKLMKEAGARDRKEGSLLADFGRVFGILEGSRQGRVDETSLDTRIQDLEKDMDGADAPADRVLAARLLYGLSEDAGGRGLGFLAVNALDKAVVCFEIAARASVHHPERQRIHLYNLACAHARRGSPKDALKSLKRSVELGFKDKALFLTDTDLDSLRKNPEFQEIIKSLGGD